MVPVADRKAQCKDVFPFCQLAEQLVRRRARGAALAGEKLNDIEAFHLPGCGGLRGGCRDRRSCNCGGQHQTNTLHGAACAVKGLQENHAFHERTRSLTLTIWLKVSCCTLS